MQYVKETTIYLAKKFLDFLWFVPDEPYLKWFYWIRTGLRLNLENPTTFNEKIQWLKLHDRKPEYTTMVDKYEAKRYAAKIIGEEYIIPTLGIWDQFDDISFDDLPGQFVLKCTHDSGGLVICKDKDSFDRAKARRKINACLKRNYFYKGREWPYKNVKPRIIAEKYISASIEYPTDQNHVIEKPGCFDEMMFLSHRLAQNTVHLRTDFYCIAGKVYFGEMTLYHESGMGRFTPKELGVKMGNWIELPKNIGRRNDV